MMIAGLLVMLAVVAALSLGIAFIFDIMAPRMAIGSRALWSALVAAFLPMSLPIVTILSELGLSSEAIIPLAGLVVAALILAAVVCFPIAYVFSKRRAANRPPPHAERAFD